MLIEKLREGAQTKAAKIILALITIPFAFWGVDSYLRRPAQQGAVATVGERVVTVSEYEETLRSQTEQYRQMLGRNFDPKMLENPVIKEGILSGLIDQRVLQEAADVARVHVTDKSIADQITAAPIFQDEGKFSKQRYETFAKQRAGSVTNFEAKLRDDLETQALRDSILNTAIASRTSSELLLKASEQSREVSVINLGYDQFASKVKLEPAQVKEFYEKNVQEFTIPEQVKVEFIELSADTLAAQSPVEASAVSQFYDTNKARFVQREERRASHVLIAAKKDAKPEEKKAAREKAEKVLAEVKAKPASFADVAKRDSDDPGSKQSGGDLGFFGRGAMVPPFETAVFKGAKDEIIGPVESDFGFHVIRVTDIRAEKTKTLDEARPEIEAELKKQNATTKLAELSSKFSDLVFTQPTSLKAAADAVKLPIQTSPLFNRSFAPVPSLNNPKMLAEIFSDDVRKNKKNTSAVEVQPGVYVAARVIEEKPSEVRPFETVKTSIEQRLQRDEATKLAKADGEAKLTDLTGGKNPNLSWPANLLVSRTKTGSLPPEVIDRVMKSDVQKLPAYIGVANSQGGYSLVRISSVVDATAADEQRTQYVSRLKGTVSQTEIQQYVEAAKQKAGVKINRTLIERKTPL